MRRVRRAIADLIGAAALAVPGTIGSVLRVAYYRARGATVGSRVRIDSGVLIDRPDLVTIGDDSWLDRYALLIAGPPRGGRETRHVGASRPDLVGRIVVGPRCHVGPHTVVSGIGGVELGADVTLSAGVKVYSLSHHLRSWSRPDDEGVVFGSQGPDELQAMLQGPVIIEANVGIAVDALILPGATIATRSFVRPHTVVSGTWPPNSILSGSPATREGPRFEQSGGPG